MFDYQRPGVATLGSLDILGETSRSQTSSLLLGVQEYAIVVVHRPGPRCLTENAKLPQVRDTFSEGKERKEKEK